MNINIPVDDKTFSHELRIPLTGILGMAELLMHEEGLSFEQKEEIALIIHSGNRLSDFVENILTNSNVSFRNSLWKNSRALVKHVSC